MCCDLFHSHSAAISFPEISIVAFLITYFLSFETHAADSLQFFFFLGLKIGNSSQFKNTILFKKKIKPENNVIIDMHSNFFRPNYAHTYLQLFAEHTNQAG